MGEWLYGEDYSRSSSSSGSFPAESLFDAYPGPLISSFVPGLELDYLELMDSEPRNLGTVQMIHQHAHQMDTGQFNTKDSIQQPQLEDFFALDQSRPSSSSSSFQSLSVGIPDFSLPISNLMPITRPATKQATRQTESRASAHQVAMPTCKEQCNTKFVNIGSDDMAITRAMLAVISSGSSSSTIPYSPSSTSLLDQPPKDAQVHQRSSNARPSAFKPYSFIAPKFEPKPHSQKMIKKAISMMRKVDQMRAESPVAESRLTTNQLPHMISERRRREKLNGSFHALRLLLPPGSKKDKASMLVSTKNYLNTLKAQICKLEEENRVLEMHLPPTEGNEGVGDSNRVDVQIVKVPESTSGLQEINIKITVTVECDITELVLQVLECLKEMRVISLTSVDAKTYSTQMSFYARTILTFQLTAKDWDEQWFKEMIVTAVGGMS